MAAEAVPRGSVTTLTYWWGRVQGAGKPQCPALETPPCPGSPLRSPCRAPCAYQLAGLQPDCHLEVTPAAPGSPPPLLPFPWGQMSFLQIWPSCTDEEELAPLHLSAWASSPHLWFHQPPDLTLGQCGPQNKELGGSCSSTGLPPPPPGPGPPHVLGLSPQRTGHPWGHFGLAGPPRFSL